MSTRFKFHRSKNRRRAAARYNLLKNIERLGAAIKQTGETQNGLGEYKGLWLTKGNLELKLGYAKTCLNNLNKHGVGKTDTGVAANAAKVD